MARKPKTTTGKPTRKRRTTATTAAPAETAIGKALERTMAAAAADARSKATARPMAASDAPRASTPTPIVPAPAHAPPAAPAVVRQVVVTKPLVPAPAPPSVLGTPVLPGPTGLEMHEVTSPDALLLPPEVAMLRGVALDVWVRAQQSPLRYAVRGDALVLTLVGRESWLDGRGGIFAQLRDLGGHPFGLCALVTCHARPGEPAGNTVHPFDPYLVLRAPYRAEDGSPVLGELWVAGLRGGQTWTTQRYGSARAAALRWSQAMPPTMRREV